MSTSDTVVVRPMNVSDRDQALGVLEKWNMAPRQATPEVPVPERSTLDLSNSFVAEHDGKVIGVASFIVHSASLAETASLAVDPAYKGQGVGYRLQAARLDEMRRRGMRRVRSETDREETVRWYCKYFGYSIVGTNPKKHAFSREDIDTWTVLELRLD